MCPFCIGAVAWAAAGALTTAGLGTLFAATIRGDDSTIGGPGERASPPSGDPEHESTR